MFESVHCFVCTCKQVPSQGKFTIGSIYNFTYIIDGGKIVDDAELEVILSENEFKVCFEIQEAVTSYSPMLKDKTIYSVYIVLQDDECNIEEIKAGAKILNINYVQAKEKLNNKKNLIAQGSAYDMRGVIAKLQSFNVQYEIEPPYLY